MNEEEKQFNEITENSKNSIIEMVQMMLVSELSKEEKEAIAQMKPFCKDCHFWDGKADLKTRSEVNR